MADIACSGMICLMARSTSVFICQQCGYKSPTFMGKCSECATWGSLVEEVIGNSDTKTGKHSKKISNIIKLSDIEGKSYDRLNSTSLEFDRVLGGGIVLGSVVLIAGAP